MRTDTTTTACIRCGQRMMWVHLDWLEDGSEWAVTCDECRKERETR